MKMTICSSPSKNSLWDIWRHELDWSHLHTILTALLDFKVLFNFSRGFLVFHPNWRLNMSTLKLFESCQFQCYGLTQRFKLSEKMLVQIALASRDTDREHWGHPVLSGMERLLFSGSQFLTLHIIDISGWILCGAALYIRGCSAISPAFTH